MLTENLKNNRRDKTRIIVDILSEAIEPATKTRLIYLANLNFNIFQRYLEILLKKGLLKNLQNNLYQTTERGKKFLENYRRLAELL
jgi:predicted transcriptional regulator